MTLIDLTTLDLAIGLVTTLGANKSIWPPQMKQRRVTLLWFLDVLSGIPPKTCASIAPNTGMRKRRGRQRDTATGIGYSV
ncbi:hypothetical protein, partial [Thiolapillus sp.]|uniref:hypothetical protein n=1 Tax=Thiolapillus sp. TaxID=2017437 RepID=UPI003AF99FCD